jgi:hypothetical protein
MGAGPAGIMSRAYFPNLRDPSLLNIGITDISHPFLDPVTGDRLLYFGVLRR